MSTTVVFRQLTMSDRSLLEDTFPEPENTPFVEKLQRQTADGYGFYGLFVDKKIVGIGQIRRQGPSDPNAMTLSDSPECSSLYVLPAMRGKGYACRLLENMEEVLRSEHYKKAGLAARDDNTAAIQLYKKFGYEPVGSIGPKLPHATVNRHYYEKSLTK